MFDQISLISLYVFAGLMALCLLVYLPRLICWFGPLTKQKHLTNDKKNRIAVIIPARNESAIIRELLDCLKGQDYPAECFDVHIVVKDPHDKTISIAKEYGYKTHVAPEQKNKGQALDSCFKALRRRGEAYDAYLVVDADCLMDKNALTEFNNAMASGKDIITGKKIVKNYYLKDKKARHLSAFCNGMIWTIIDELGNRWKSDHGYRTMTITCGILFTKRVIDQLRGFPYDQTMTEDMELMFANPLRGFSTYYCSYAHVYMEEASSLKMTDLRRSRWIKGYVSSKRIYEPELRDQTSGFKALAERYFLTGMYIPFWMYGLCLFYIALCLGYSFALLLSGTPNVVLYPFLCAVIAFAYIYLTFFVLTAACLIADHKYIKCSFFKKVALLFIHPFFYMGYFRISIKALLGKEEEKWDPIERNVALEKK
jgi:cellulose synthase/poly-beta-1,6-N-acetylglucosamine synthase-like glycosyltransferase